MHFYEPIYTSKMIDLIIPKKTRNYIPQDLEMKWENLAPIFDELLSRRMETLPELEKWLKDKSELEA